MSSGGARSISLKNECHPTLSIPPESFRYRDSHSTYMLPSIEDDNCVDNVLRALGDNLDDYWGHSKVGGGREMDTSNGVHPKLVI